ETEEEDDIEPEKLYHYFNGNRLYTSGDFNAAVDEYTLAIQKGDNVIESHYERALSFLKLRKFESAVHDFTEALPIEGEIPDFNKNYADALLGAKKYNEASVRYAKSLDKVKKKNSSEAFDIYKSRGDVYKILGEYDKAIEDYKKLTNSNRADLKADSHRDIGITYRAWGKIDLAIESYMTYLRLTSPVRNEKGLLEAFKICRENNKIDAGFKFLRMYCEEGGSKEALGGSIDFLGNNFANKSRLKLFKCKEK
ncbi:MAG: hypothetical protein AAF696_38490, partial [Bacteroidota bacterium]